jgi:hypothetical protein
MVWLETITLFVAMCWMLTELLIGERPRLAPVRVGNAWLSRAGRHA